MPEMICPGGNSLWDQIVEQYNNFIITMQSFKVTDVLDIVIVSFLIYSLIKIMRETRAEQLVKGILILLVAYAVSTVFSLKMLNTLFVSFFQFSVLAVLIVFQPELRSALEHIGRSKIGKYWSGLAAVSMEEEQIKRVRKCINCVVEVANKFQKSKTGALIVFERQTKLGEIIDTGTVVDAVPSEEMIGNIFFNKAPLHDGAMIIRSGKVHAAGCILPLTENEVSRELGTRHRAAVGMSETSDAMVIVVSEETGAVSVAKDGKLNRNLTSGQLLESLNAFMLPKEDEKKPKVKRRKHHEKP